MPAKKTFTLLVLAFIGATNLLAQQNNSSIIVVQRPADYEYLSAPDSLGVRHPLAMPSSSRSNSQNLPYPIIFIHGLNSNSETWVDTKAFMLTHYNLTYGGRIDYCLNHDEDNTTANTNVIQPPVTNHPTVADIATFSPTTLTAADFYYVNFDVGSDGSFSPYFINNVKSNQQAIVKQGIALKDAIARVLQKTGRDKVILMGHSMGGLASREYLQNPSIWQSDGEHHVAKLVTTGTPHRGSDAFGPGFNSIFPDGQSEAVRDLRTSYTYSHHDGVYLFGGIEDLAYMEDQLIYYFYNADVNCDGGASGGTIVGLNDKAIPTDLDYSCIIGSLPGINTDGAVSNVSADINNCCQTLITTNVFPVTLPLGHIGLPGSYYENMQGLDEPNEYELGYHIGLDTTYTGFITVQATNSPFSNDYDDFKFSLPQDGDVNVSVSCMGLSNLAVRIIDLNGYLVGTNHPSSGAASVTFTEAVSAGDYYFEIAGIPTPTSYLNPYNFTLNSTICPLPVSAFNISSIIGNDVAFNNTSTNATDYYWDFGDGFATTFSDPTHTYANTGTYTVTLTASNSCGSSSFEETINLDCPDVVAYIYQQTTSPVCQGNTVPLDAYFDSNYDYLWIQDGINLVGGNFPYYDATQSGSYSVEITDNSGCSVISSAVDVTIVPIPTATIAATGATSFCQGGSVVLNTNQGSGYTYQWKRNGNIINGAATSSYTATQGGSYSVVVADNGCSISSGVVAVTVAPNPVSSFSYNNSGTVVSFSNTSFNATTYLWAFGDGTTSNLQSPSHTYSGSGSYNVTLTVSGSGCGSNSSTQTIVVCSTVASITAQNATIFCQGGSVVLSATPSSGYTYQWIQNGTNLANTLSSYTATQAGTYWVILTGNGCSAVSDPISITTAISPVCNFSVSLSAGFTPLTTNFSDNSSSTPTQWQWSFPGGNPSTSSVKNPAVIYSASGLYDVSLKITNACGTDSITKTHYINVLPTDIENISAITNISVFPNPNSGIFTVSIISAGNQKVKLNLFNSLGQLITKQEIETTTGVSKTDFNLSPNAKGIYFLQIQAEGRNSYMKISVE